MRSVFQPTDFDAVTHTLLLLLSLPLLQRGCHSRAIQPRASCSSNLRWS